MTIGWASDYSISYTWFEVALRRPAGRSDIASIRIHHNPVGSEAFVSQTTQWDTQSTSPRAKWWLGLLRPGDIIQLIPRAQFPCWVNIIREGIIEIEYDVQGQEENTHNDPKLPPHDVEKIEYIYEPLDYVHRQIRILVVKAGSYESDIEAQFEHINLADTSDQRAGFDALSYCWGDSSEKGSISLLDAHGKIAHKMGISGTLERAIRRFRSSEEPLRIWIDAACINQHDKEERAQQVAMMGSIYASTDMVRIWLDDHVLGLDTALRVIRDIYNANKRICPGASQCQCSGTKHTLSTKELDEITAPKPWHTFGYTREVFGRYHDMESFDASAVDAAGGQGEVAFTNFMQTFFHHPWFQRVWVVQEAILSRKTTVYSVKEAIPWEELLFINEMASTPEYAGEARWSVQARDSMPAIWNSLARRHNRKAKQGADEKNGQDWLPILDVFLRAQDLKATNACDKLFALLSFGRETREPDRIPPPLRPDYDKDLEDIMADFTRWWILEYRSLDIFSFIHCQPGRAWRCTLSDSDNRMNLDGPSWVLGTDGYTQCAPMNLRQQFPLMPLPAVVADTVPDEDLIRLNDGDDDDKANRRQLALRGYKVGGKVMVLGHPPEDMVSARNKDESTLAAVFHRLFDPSARMGVWLLQGINYHEEHWDVDKLEGFLADHVGAHFNYIAAPAQHTLVPPASDDEKWSSYRCDDTMDLPSCVDKFFFVLSNGMYGLCPWTAQRGDVVALLHGGKVPYLLRLLSDGVGDGQDAASNKYQLVGECFVEGIADKTVGDGLGELETFVLV